MNTIYPTATHNRWEHSIGAFRNACLYSVALLNDYNNPLFRQLLTEEDVKCLLLAALLHDLGQYPLGHDIEETIKDLKHENFTLALLDNPTKDRFGRTLQDILGNKVWGWGVKVENIKKILIGVKDTSSPTEKNKLKIKMMASVINGPIDVDKLDYLLRDSQKCYLKYGQIIDVERLVRSLTIVLSTDGGVEVSCSVGAYEKGQSAAESMTFARYLLYQALYWHHTARSIRLMLREALKAADNNIVTVPKESGRSQSAKAQLSLIKNSGFVELFAELMGIKQEPKVLTIEEVLRFINNYTDETGKQMIELIRSRNYYKRVLTIHSELPKTSGKEDPLDLFKKTYDKEQFQELLQGKILQAYHNQLQGKSTGLVSQLSPDLTDKVINQLSKPKQILCDIPPASYGSDELLRFIPEPQRLQKNYISRGKTGQRVSEVWQKVHFTLMNIASKGRIYCHPDIRDSLMSVLGPELIKEQVDNTVKETLAH